MSYINKIQVDGVDYDLEAPQIYDDQERVIGTWFGKPIYRKGITITVQEYNALPADSSSRKQYDVSLLHIEKLLKADTITVYVVDNVQSKKTYSMHSVSTNSAYETGVHNLVGNDLIIFVGSTIISNLEDNIHLILEYTKTTDIVE